MNAVFDPLTREYKNLIYTAARVAPGNPDVIEARRIYDTMAPENQLEALRSIEELEESLRSIIRAFDTGPEYQAYMETLCYQCRSYDRPECPGIDICYWQIKLPGPQA